MVKARFSAPNGSRPVAATLAPFVKPEKPQVFPRAATSFIKNKLIYLQFRRRSGQSRQCTKPTQVQKRKCRRVPFLLIFRGGLAPHKHNHKSRERTSSTPVHHRIMLLMFAPGVLRQFRFVATVTILQHTVRRSPSDMRPTRVAARNPGSPRQENHRTGAC